MAITAPTGSIATRRQLPRRWRDFTPLAILVLLLIIVAIGQPAFFSSSGLTVLGTQTVPVLLLALGQSVVMMVGAIDLASASLAVFSAIVVATTLPALGIGSPIFTLLLGGVLGGITGFLTAYFQIPSFAVTLGALGVWQALALVLSNSTTVYVDKNSGAISWLTEYGIANVPSVIIVSVLAAVGLWLLLRYTTFGRATRAVGLNERSALLGGQSAVRTKVLAFAISGAFAAAAGIALTAQQGTATASGLGVGLLLPGIAAAVAGGVAITGGIGNPLNVIVGALIVSLIPIGSAAIGVDPRIQQIVYGAIVILAVMATIDRSRSRVIK